MLSFSEKRNVLYIQGFTRGIKREDMQKAKNQVEKMIHDANYSSRPFTTIIFDGDPMPCAPPPNTWFPNGASSFVLSSNIFAKSFQILRSFTSKQTKVTKCLFDMNPEPSSEVWPKDGPLEWRQWYGAWPMFTTENTKIVDMDDPFDDPFDRTIRNMGVGTPINKILPSHSRCYALAQNETKHQRSHGCSDRRWRHCQESYGKNFMRCYELSIIEYHLDFDRTSRKCNWS